jgi:prolyl-tRNA synthetase
MKWTKYFIPTLREDPKEAEVASHKLMLRGGFIQKLAGGLYTYLPLGFRVIQKVSKIIREELNKRDAIELQMPILQPREIWEQSGRWGAMGPLMMRFKNREEKEFVLGPTHEEIITNIVASSIRSYKDLPKNFYQMQTKFRDEIRPRFGVIRAKEFIMKDGYSFHASDESANEEYKKMYEAYTDIFRRCGLTAKPIEADTGAMGGNQSHEFTVPAPSGEDIIAECTECNYAANLELAVRKPVLHNSNKSSQPIEEVDTPNLKKVEELTVFFDCASSHFIKTLIYKINDNPTAVLVRGDVDVSEPKLRRVMKTNSVELSDEETILKVTGAPVGFSGPVGLNLPIVADESIQGMIRAVTGANKKDKHFKNVDIGRDFKVEKFYDIGSAKEGDFCRQCNKPLKFAHGIEVGQVFKLGTKYSEKLNAVYLDEKGVSNPMIMGCYGIGVSRTVAAIIECNNDANGIVWPMAVAPFSVLVVPINYADVKIKDAADSIYEDLNNAGIEVLLDDRNETAGIKFKDGDLIGIPIKVVLGKKFAETGKVEIKMRKDGSVKMADKTEVLNIIKELKGV